MSDPHCVDCAHYREHWRDGTVFAPMCHRPGEISRVTGKYIPHGPRTCEFERNYERYSHERDQLDSPCLPWARHFQPRGGDNLSDIQANGT